MADARTLGLAVQDFLFQVEANGRRRSSICSYARELDALTRHLGDPPLATITPDDVSRFLASPAACLRRNGTGKAGTTLNRTRSVIRTFFAWCVDSARIPSSPAFFVRPLIGSVPRVGHMTRRQLERFLFGIRHSNHRLAPRDHALFSTLAYTGVRLSEAAGAVWADLDERGGRLHLRSTKGGHAETRHVPRRLLATLVQYRRRIPAEMRTNAAPLFASQARRALCPRSVQYRFAFWLAWSEIRQQVSVHSLRHTFGTLLYRATRDLLLVSRALGHRDVRSTQRYVHLEDRALARAVNRL